MSPTTTPTPESTTIPAHLLPKPPVLAQPLLETAATSAPLATPQVTAQAAVPDDLREVKVKLPLDQVLRLHLARMKKRESVSKIVSSALTRYFEEFTQA